MTDRGGLVCAALVRYACWYVETGPSPAMGGRHQNLAREGDPALLELYRYCFT
jgi:hypothetical protein